MLSIRIIEGGIHFCLVLEGSLCSHTNKPKERKVCNKTPCPFTWIASDWSQVLHTSQHRIGKQESKLPRSSFFSEFIYFKVQLIYSVIGENVSSKSASILLLQEGNNITLRKLNFLHVHGQALSGFSAATAAATGSRRAASPATGSTHTAGSTPTKRPTGARPARGRTS